MGDGGQSCQPCGASGQACCAGNTCNTGLGCDDAPDMGGGRTCVACGGLDQPCCGSNMPATGTCSTNLECMNVQGMGATCVMP